jgi:elongation factor 1 alpha-like protein
VIKKKLNYYLYHIGFTEEQIIYVPVSAFSGVNITKKINRHFEAESQVYARSIADTLRELPLPVRPLNKPFRMSINNFYESDFGKLKGHVLTGKIEGGVLKKDDKLLILPQNTQCFVKDIVKNDEKVKRAIVGDHVDVLIKLLDETYFETIKYGNVLSSLQYSIPVVRKFTM